VAEEPEVPGLVFLEVPRLANLELSLEQQFAQIEWSVNRRRMSVIGSTAPPNAPFHPPKRHFHHSWRPPLARGSPDSMVVTEVSLSVATKDSPSARPYALRMSRKKRWYRALSREVRDSVVLEPVYRPTLPGRINWDRK